VDIPVACTLEAPMAQQRIARWRDVLAKAVVQTARPAPGRLACVLHADLADLRALVLLAQEEQACCPFFTFSFDVEAAAVTMMVGVPEDAVAILDGFARLSDAEPDEADEAVTVSPSP
jgi:hypothetical protein